MPASFALNFAQSVVALAAAAAIFCLAALASIGLSPELVVVDDAPASTVPGTATGEPTLPGALGLPGDSLAPGGGGAAGFGSVATGACADAAGAGLLSLRVVNK